MSVKRNVPEVNAGSMADIAFLLLIFFLVTTTLETNAGIKRMLPRDTNENATIAERNILRVNLNADNKLMVNEQIIELSELRAKAIAFLDNGGAVKTSSDFCNYCKGERLPYPSSDNPSKAIVSLSSSRNTSYSFYIHVQNELVGAYNELRNREAMRLYGKTYASITAAYNDQLTPVGEGGSQKSIENLTGFVSMKLSEAQIK